MRGPRRDVAHDYSPLAVCDLKTNRAFITAYGDETVRSRALEAGAVECLFKPFSETALLDAIDAALRGS